MYIMKELFCGECVIVRFKENEHHIELDVCY